MADAFDERYGRTLFDRAYPAPAADVDDEDPKKMRITEDTLRQSNGWAHMARTVHELFEGKPFNGTDEQAANYGLATVANFEYNMALGTVPKAAEVVTKATPQQAQAFATMLDLYDMKNVTWEGAGRAVKEVLTDPTTYIGLSTVGLGLAGRGAAKAGASAAFRKQLAEIIAKHPAKAGAVEAGAYTGAADVARQSVDVAAGKQDSIDPTQTAVATGVGAAAGATLVKAAEGVVKAAKNVADNPDLLRSPAAGGPAAQRGGGK